LGAFILAAGIGVATAMPASAAYSNDSNFENIPSTLNNGQGAELAFARPSSFLWYEACVAFRPSIAYPTGLPKMQVKKMAADNSAKTLEEKQGSRCRTVLGR